MAAAGWHSTQIGPRLRVMVTDSTYHRLHAHHTSEYAQGMSPLVSGRSAQPTGTISPAQAAPDTLCRAAFAAAPLLHAGALFSNSFVLAEGRMLGFGLATLTLLLSRSALLPPPLPHQQQQRQRQSTPPAQPEASSLNAVRAPAVKSPEGKCWCAASDGTSAQDSGDEANTAKAPLEDIHGTHGFAGPQLAAEDAADRQRTARVLATAAAVLMLLWALGQRGLVVRSGHDAMWRTAAEHRTVLSSPDASSEAQWGHAASSVFVSAAAEYLPLAVLPWCLLRAKHSMLAKSR